MGEGGGGRGAVVSGAAAVSKLGTVEGAAARGSPREAVLLRGADAMDGRGGGRPPRRGTATHTNTTSVKRAP